MFFVLLAASCGLSAAGNPSDAEVCTTSECQLAYEDDDTVLLQRFVIGGTPPPVDQPDVPLHCCFAPPKEAVVLACDYDENDKIIGVPYAALSMGHLPPWQWGSNPGNPHPVCGADAPRTGSGVSDITSSVHKECVGKRSCEVKSGGDWRKEEMLVRWTCLSDANAANLTFDESLKLPPLPLRAEGAMIVDATGARFRLKAVNWAGGHVNGAPDGLDRAPLEVIARRVRTLGFNAVRLTWSVKSLQNNFVPDQTLVDANPRLRGMTSMQLYLETSKALGKEGIIVILDNHMLNNDWCCDTSDCDGFWWNKAVSEDDFHQSLAELTTQASEIPAVVGMGLRNEPRSLCGGKSWDGAGEFCNATFFDPTKDAEGCVEMRWHTGGETYQWKLAAERAAQVILEKNDKLLITIAGLEYAGDLRDLGTNPPDVPKQNLVYEAHEYWWFLFMREPGMAFPAHPDIIVRNIGDAQNRCATDSTCAGITCDANGDNCRLGAGELQPSPDHLSFEAKYNVVTFHGYENSLNKYWGHILEQNSTPVWLSEFGFAHDVSSFKKTWVHQLKKYTRSVKGLSKTGGMDMGYWSLNGYDSGGTGRSFGSTETYGVLGHCYTAPASKWHYRQIKQFLKR